MAEYAVMPKSDYQAACDKIRAKTGKTETIKSGDLAAEIDSIGGADPVIHSLTVTENGTYEAPDGVDGYNPVMVNVASSGGSEMEEQFIRAIERDESKPVTKLPEGLTKIGEEAFKNFVNLILTSLPDGVMSIGNSAFLNCDKLALTSLPDGITSIGDNTFNGCTNLALTALPDGLTYIGYNSFCDCTNLALTALPDGVTEIKGYAFEECTNLTEITFEGKPNKVDGTAFKDCTNLLTINVPWAEGEVTNAPWGATNATINYNYTGG